MNRRWLSLGLFLMLLAAGTASTLSHGQPGSKKPEDDELDKPKPCDSCHEEWASPQVFLAAPFEAPVNSTIQVFAFYLNHGQPARANRSDDDGYPYRVEDYAANLNVSQPLRLDLVNDGHSQSSILRTGEDHSQLWTAHTGSPGGYDLLLSAKGLAFYRHNTPQPNDYRFEQYVSTETIRVRETPLGLSASLLLTTMDRSTTHSLVIWAADGTLSNITLGKPNPQIVGVKRAGVPRELALGESALITLNLTPKEPGLSRLPIRWVDQEGSKGVFNLTLAVAPSTSPPPEGIPRLFGRSTGLLGLGLLVTTALFGAPLGLRKRLNRGLRKLKITARRRIRFHCWLSFAILIVGVIHGLQLIVGAYFDIGLTNWGLRLWLGWTSAILFGALGLHGYFRTAYVKRRNYREWLRGHQILSIAALVAVVIHGLLVGTDLRPGRFL